MLLQAGYSDNQIGAFENFHQLVEDTLIVLRPGPKVFFQNELGFVDCLKSQLLISHLFLPIKIADQSPLLTHQTKCCPKEKAQKIKLILGDIPAVFNYPINFCFNVEALSVRSRWLSGFNTASACEDLVRCAEGLRQAGHCLDDYRILVFAPGTRPNRTVRRSCDDRLLPFFHCDALQAVSGHNDAAQHFFQVADRQTYEMESAGR